ncbi:hypothetical protein AAF712_009611 [Marasmius tenuissimus]|uniref:Uncharacterized protein n=1 Tax=Marasmius tenuissimus TaxID=585030 RepID=A0ABR2ZQR5_9AGAR
MKFNTILAAIVAGSGVALAQSRLDGYGFLSPAVNQVVNVTENPFVNVTFNPHRYFKESTRSLDIWLLFGEWATDNQDTDTHPHTTQELVTAMEPNIAVTWENINTPAYYANVYVKGLPVFPPETMTIMVREKYGGLVANMTQAFYSRKIQLVE